MGRFEQLRSAFKSIAMTIAFSATAIIPFIGLAEAAIVQSDWKNVGDGLVTRDLANSRDWLDLTQTTGLTVAQAIAQTGVGGRLEGWRFANMDELFSFYRSAVGPVTPAFNGNTPIFDFSASELSGLTNFVDLLGVTFQLSFRNDVLGLVGHSAAFSDSPFQSAGIFFYQTNGSGGFAWFNEGYTLPTYSDANTGIYMIRNVAGPAVPEPASWLLMIGGFGLVGGVLRQRRRGTIHATN